MGATRSQRLRGAQVWRESLVMPGTREGARPFGEVRLEAPDGTWAVVAPERGGMATRFVVGGRDVFYLDQATYLDAGKNVRGGNPVLFPSPGKLTNDRWTHGKLSQHGFARTSAWRVASHDAARAELALVLTDDEATRAVYPFGFEARTTYRVEPGALVIAQQFTCTSGGPMPFGAGFHPYFAVPQADKAQTRIPTAARRAFDNRDKQTKALDRIDLTADEVDLHLLGHGSTSGTLDAPGMQVEITCSPAFSHWVVWTLAGKDFVCLEPWTCPGDALNTGERLLTLEDGASIELETRIAATLR